MNSLARRVRKLELVSPDEEDLSVYAADDLQIEIMDIEIRVAAIRASNPPDPEAELPEADRAWLETRRAEDLAGIRRLAALREHPDYQRALDVLRAEFPGFVPAISGWGSSCGSDELRDLGRPGLFERRAAICNARTSRR